MDLVSVIVPVYNTEKYIGECIESILHQTYKNIELVLVNDGSTDGSLEICERYGQIDQRIRVISKTNSGASDARNLGMCTASGQYICFVDSDDMLKSKCIEVLYNGIISDDVDAAFCNFEYCYDGRLIKKKYNGPKSLTQNQKN